MSRKIVKIGLAVMDSNGLLLVRKKGGQSYILPGGKPEEGEDDCQALIREVGEELGCTIDAETLTFLGDFTDVAADMVDTEVVVKLYHARLIGNPAAMSEIECLGWFKPESIREVTLAPSIQNKIIPFLYSTGRFEAV